MPPPWPAHPSSLSQIGVLDCACMDCRPHNFVASAVHNCYTFYCSLPLEDGPLPRRLAGSPKVRKPETLSSEEWSVCHSTTIATGGYCGCELGRMAGTVHLYLR